jgi:hypothetical protein
MLFIRKTRKATLPDNQRHTVYFRWHAESHPQARKTALESFVDLSLLQELEQSGFFKQLWKN